MRSTTYIWNIMRNFVYWQKYKHNKQRYVSICSLKETGGFSYSELYQKIGKMNV